MMDHKQNEDTAEDLGTRDVNSTIRNYNRNCWNIWEGLLKTKYRSCSINSTKNGRQKISGTSDKKDGWMGKDKSLIRDEEDETFFC
jgi:hypothetical protein